MKPVGPRAAPGRLLLHICCAPDASHGVSAFGAFDRVAGFFYNPNIAPPGEWARRLEAVNRLRDALPFDLEVAEGGEEEWEDAARGLEDEPEKGKRCEACIRLRLARTAREARRSGSAAFATTLTVSPRKDAAMVNRIGREEGAKEGVLFVEADLKKKDGFRKSVEISKRLGLYRQNYCGCRFSFRPPAD